MSVCTHLHTCVSSCRCHGHASWIPTTVWVVGSLLQMQLLPTALSPRSLCAAQDLCRLHRHCLVRRTVALSLPQSRPGLGPDKPDAWLSGALGRIWPHTWPQAAISRWLPMLVQPLTPWGGSGPGQLAVPQWPDALARPGAGLMHARLTMLLPALRSPAPGTPISSPPTTDGPSLAGVATSPGHSMAESEYSKYTGTGSTLIKQSDQVRRPQQSGGQLAETWRPVLIWTPPL